VDYSNSVDLSCRLDLSAGDGASRDMKPRGSSRHLYSRVRSRYSRARVVARWGCGENG
jgi:hypothetical protein